MNLQNASPKVIIKQVGPGAAKKVIDQQASTSPINSNHKNEKHEAIDELADSTDVSKAGDITKGGRSGKNGICGPQKYDWSDVTHLFEDGVIPDELLEITDPVEYNYILIRLKKDFNDKNKSDFLKYMNL